MLMFQEWDKGRKFGVKNGPKHFTYYRMLSCHTQALIVSSFLYKKEDIRLTEVPMSVNLIQENIKRLLLILRMQHG